MDEQHFPSLTPYIVVRNAQEAIDFYVRAFGGSIRSIAKTPDGQKIMNAQLVIGDSVLMLNDEFPDYDTRGPQPGENLPMVLHINSNNIDSDFQRAVDAGVEVTMQLADMFWGDRYGQFTCPFGYKWSMGQKIANPTPEEMDAAAREAFGSK
jgi:uncharacterized glyoxalase superfamily protein PhnB